MKTHPELERFEAEYAGLIEQARSGILDPAAWMTLINRMRIWGYVTQADEIVEELRRLKDANQSND